MKNCLQVAVAILWLATAFSSAESLQHYFNHSVYRLMPNSVAQLELLHNLEDEVDFWREPDQVNRFADVMLTPQNKQKLLEFFNENSIQHELVIPDVEKLIENERAQQKRAVPFSKTTRDTEAVAGFWNSYQRFDSHVAFVDALVQQNSEIAAKITLGTSYEGRTLVAVRIGANSAASQKPVVWIEGGIHAREWISPATVTYFSQQLVNKYNAGDADVVELLNYFDFYIVPVLNADGYEYTHTSTRLWRKTRRPNSGSTCIGADPNRNFGYQWGGSGASTNPCAETYRGDSAFSEPEVKAEQDYILNNLAGRVKSFVAVHSYGQYWLYPWGFDSSLTPDDTEINRVAKIAVAALNVVSPTIRYTIGTSTNVLYAAAGGAHDWSYGTVGATYSYTAELRDTGTYGFQLPASQIGATGEETSAAFFALFKEVKNVLA